MPTGTGHRCEVGGEEAGAQVSPPNRSSLHVYTTMSAARVLGQVVLGVRITPLARCI